MARATRRPGAEAGLGGFAGLFDLKAAGFHDPLLLAANDGVGTKVKIAIDADRHDTVGIDLVAMCVNDLVVQGAEPLFFLDYLATGKLRQDVAEALIAGIAEGCRQAGCALIGGETAEMPGLYQDKDYDLAGFAVGAVERGGLLTGETVRAGDKLIGLASSGLHSNGFSLVRRLIADFGLELMAPAPFAPEQSLADALLCPTRIYVRSCLGEVRAGRIKAMAHITGGGLPENLPRVLPPRLGARLDGTSWSVPAVFPWLSELGGIAADEMARTFNCGLGMILVVAPEVAEETIFSLQENGESCWNIGEIISHKSDTARVRIERLAV